MNSMSELNLEVPFESELLSFKKSWDLIELMLFDFGRPTYSQISSHFVPLLLINLVL